MFLAATVACIVVTILVKFGGGTFRARPGADIVQVHLNEHDSHPPLSIEPGNGGLAPLPPTAAPASGGPAPSPASEVQANGAPSPAPTAGKTPLVAVAEPVRPPLALEVKPDAHPGSKTPIKTLPLAEVAALNGSKPVLRGPLELPRPQRNAEKAPDLEPNQEEEKKNDPPSLDPLTGIWTSATGLRVSRPYVLPIEGKEINSARQIIDKAGVVRMVEIQWWYPRTVDVTQMHWRGKIAKLRFLGVVKKDKLEGKENRSKNEPKPTIRAGQVLGTTADGANSLVIADAIVYSPAWHLLSNAVKEKPKWFRDGNRSIKRGGAEELPVKGPEIELVRKAVREAAPRATIREVKWWPPRMNRVVGHKMSKLRIEVNVDGDIRTAEMVFDHTDEKAINGEQLADLFPESDQRTSKIEPAATAERRVPAALQDH
jgi:predicted small lipoprotein YifL